MTQRTNKPVPIVAHNKRLLATMFSNKLCTGSSSLASCLLVDLVTRRDQGLGCNDAGRGGKHEHRPEHRLGHRRPVRGANIPRESCKVSRLCAGRAHAHVLAAHVNSPLSTVNSPLSGNWGKCVVFVAIHFSTSQHAIALIHYITFIQRTGMCSQSCKLTSAVRIRTTKSHIPTSPDSTDSKEPIFRKCKMM
jgi:hypothetical protein